MSKFDELERKITHYRWLTDIASKYKEMLALIEREKESFTIQGFSYTARSDGEYFNINCHRTIPYTFIRDGLKAALDGINAELAECEKDLDGWI